jgi:hypothetical protein
MNAQELETMREVMIGVALSVALVTRSDLSQITAALKLFAQSHVNSAEAKATLSEIADGVAMFGEKLKQQAPRPS